MSEIMCISTPCVDQSHLLSNFCVVWTYTEYVLTICELAANHTCHIVDYGGEGELA